MERWSQLKTKLRKLDLVSCPRNSRYIAGGQLAVFQGGPSRTSGKAPISESYGSIRRGGGKTANWPARGNVSAYRRVGVSAFPKHHQLRRDLLAITAVSKSGLASPDADTPTRFCWDDCRRPARGGTVSAHPRNWSSSNEPHQQDR
jgi:hypothetical protein